MRAKEHPGVYVPPPLIYAAFFLCSLLLQKLWPLNKGWLYSATSHIIGWILTGFYFVLAFIAIRQFIVSKNTIVTVKPATTLETGGIYAFTRNPMYLSLILLYCGLACLLGNWWTFILLPFLIIVIQLYVIRREEHYLHTSFGAQYDAYRKRVRRWI
jgi:protein-S-isoprenylcysteine O-methyltransferase Ste14